ncbi:MAG: RuvB-like helicase [Nitrososphaerota archaeon]|nr:RuvB-like helicase [Nitrososphaerota archaeon]
MALTDITDYTSRRITRVGAHSHIKGLGLDGLKAKPIEAGLVGQIEAREAAGIVVKMIKEGRMAGRAVLFAGPPGTGKTAIAYAIAKELGRDVPFVALSGSEIYSSEMKKTEVLTQAMRRAIGVRLREQRRVYEGEVTQLDIRTRKHPYNPYQEIPDHVVIGLATKDDKRVFRAGQSIAIHLIQQGITLGDIIMIDAETGKVTKLGRSEEAAEKYEITTWEEKPIPRPSGPVEKNKEFVYVLTLHDLDQISAQQRGGGLFSLFFGGSTSREIDSEIRRDVDDMVKKRLEEGTAEIIPGVLFIDEVHLLDIEAFSFLNAAMENELAPILIFASNRGITKVRGTDIESPHGIPLDLLDRLLIISTRPYTRDEVRKILEIRAAEEKVKISREALEALTDIGVSSTLRYAVQLLRPSMEIAKGNGREEIMVEDINIAKTLFSDIRRSVEELRRFEELMLK